MQVAAATPDEAERLHALRALALLDTPPEALYDDLTAVAARLAGTPISLISLVDENRQWFKSRFGLDAEETPRDWAFCAHAIHDSVPFVVGDASRDARFADNPLVTGAPDIRFYAGAPLETRDGHRVGTLCVIDRKPRELDADVLEALQALSRHAMVLMESRFLAEHLRQAEDRARQLLRVLPVCGMCRRPRLAHETQAAATQILDGLTEPQVIITMCRDCRAAG